MGLIRRAWKVGGWGMALALSACATTGVAGHPETDETIEAPAAPLPIQWAVLDRFRLLTQPGATRKQVERNDYYFESVSSQINDEGMLPTHWQLASESYDAKYLDVKEWQVRLGIAFAGQCTWSIKSASQPSRTKTADCNRFDLTIPRDPRATDAAVGEATEVSVVIQKLENNPNAHSTLTIQPRDVLIATLGDSYASGEGVPDLRAHLFSKAKWMDTRCHRSLYSGPSQAALMYAELNPHVSVTHLTLACSGAQLGVGLLKPYSGMERPEGRPETVPPQVEVLRDLLQASHRTPDILTITAGGNDLGFSKVIEAAMTSSGDKLQRRVEALVSPGLASAREQVKLLAQKLREAHIDPARTQILIPEYPNPTNLFRVPEGAEVVDGQEASDADWQNACGTRHTVAFTAPIFRGLTLGKLTLRPADIKVIDDQMVGPLHGFLEEFAGAVGGKVVHGIDADFETHGYCAPGLHSVGGEDRWINTMHDSHRMLRSYDGAMHPNIRGQNSIGRHILEGIVQAECQQHIPASDAAYHRLCDSNDWKLEIPGFQQVVPFDL